MANRAIWSKAVLNILAFGLFISLWQAAATSLRSRFFPDAVSTMWALFRLAAHGDIEGYTLLAHITASLIRIGGGFALACAMAIPFGVLMGLFPAVYDGLRVLIEPFRFIPPVAWIPLTIVMLSGFARYVFLIWLGAFFPILISTRTGISRIDQIYVDVARVHGADGSYILKRIIMPSILPEIFSGTRIGIGVGWMCIVAAEMIGGEMIGLGRLILKYAELLRLEEVIAGMLLIGLIGLGINEAFVQAEKRLFKWRTEIRV